jgi:AraC-like DNA-binding protein
METDIHHFYAVMTGQVEIQTRGKWYAATSRTFAYFRPGMRYAIRPSRRRRGPVQVLVIQFCPPKNWKPPPQFDPMQLPGHWWRRLLELDATCDFDRFGRRILHIDSVLQFFNNVAKAAAVPGTTKMKGKDPHRVDTLASWVETWARAEDVIRLRISSGLTIDELACAVNVSPVQLRRIYAAAAGIPPKQSLTNWRMFEARKLIAEGQHSIGRISQLLGYGSSQRFCTAFKAAAGKSPGSYAKNPGQFRANSARR